MSTTRCGSPCFSASATVRPTLATCGMVNTTDGVAYVSAVATNGDQSEVSTSWPRARATIAAPAWRAWYLPMWVSCRRPLTSPTPYSQGSPFTCWVSSTSRYSPGSSPTVSKPMSPLPAARPTATSTSSARISPSEVVSTTSPPSRRAAVTSVPTRTSTPRSRSEAATASHAAGTEHQQPSGHLLRAGRLPRSPGADAGQAVDRRDGGLRPGADRDGVPGGQPGAGAVLAGHDDGPLAVEPSGAAQERDAGAVDPLHLPGVVPVGGEHVAPGQGGGDVLLAGHGLPGAVDRARLGQHFGRPQQRLAAHAGPVGALAADQLVLDQRRGHPAADGDVGDVLAGGSGTEDDDVVGLLRCVGHPRHPVGVIDFPPCPW